MKKRMFLFSPFVFLFVCVSDAITFKEFERLTPDQREATYAAADAATQEELRLWNWKLSFGEEGWRQRQRERLYNHEGLFGIESLVSTYKTLGQTYTMLRWTKVRRNKLPAAELEAERVRLVQLDKSYEDLHLKVKDMLPNIAPIREARELARKCHKISTGWSDHWLAGKKSKSTIVTGSDMARLDQEMGEIIASLEKLPKLTPAQVEDAINALSEDRPGGINPESPID